MTQTIAGLTPVLVFSYQYSVVSLRTELSATIGGTADFVNTYDYDALGRLIQLTQDDQAGYAVAEKRVDFTYDAASRYNTITRYANLAGTQEVATGTYTFDALNRLTSLIYTQPNSTGLPYYGWTYNAAGNMTWMETIDGEVDYTHDDTDQLTDADYDYQTDENYEYDSNGNRTNAGYVTGPNNQLLSYGMYRYEYDAEGNRTLRYVDADSSETLNSGDTDITEYEWDYRNRLTKVEYFTTYTYYDAGTSHQIVEYTYDCFNRLIKRVLDPDGTSGATAIEQSIYVYENGQIVAQFDKTGTGDLAATDLSHRYLWNPQAVDQLFSDEQIHWDDQEEEFITDDLLWALTDHLNSIRDLAVYDAQNDETTIALHRVLDSFGNVALSCGSAECLFGYTGKLFDDATQLQNNWNNWYDALVGRWLGEDKEQSDVNLTCYCGNSPLTNTDPLGLSTTSTTQDIQNQISQILATKQPCACKPRHLLGWVYNERKGSGLYEAGPGVFEYKNFGDLIINIAGQLKKDDPATEICECECVGVLELAGHGDPFSIYIGGIRHQAPVDLPTEEIVGQGDEVDEANILNGQNVTGIGTELKKRVNFCQPCMIILSGCNTGLAKNSWIKELTVTGCTVVGAGGYKRGSFFYGDVEISAVNKTPGGGEPGTYHERHPGMESQTYDSKDDTWYVFKP